MHASLQRIATVIAIGSIAIVTAGCQKEGPAERAGKQVDKAAEKVGQSVEKAGDKIQDAAKK